VSFLNDYEAKSYRKWSQMKIYDTTHTQASLQAVELCLTHGSWTEKQYEDEDTPIYVHPSHAMTADVEDDGP
jgi:hypothetical protein